MPEVYDLCNLSGSHGLGKALVQPIEASWELIPQASIVNITSSKAEHGWPNQGIGFTKGIMYQGKNYKSD